MSRKKNGIDGRVWLAKEQVRLATEYLADMGGAEAAGAMGRDLVASLVTIKLLLSKALSQAAGTGKMDVTEFRQLVNAQKNLTLALRDLKGQKASDFPFPSHLTMEAFERARARVRDLRSRLLDEDGEVVEPAVDPAVQPTPEPQPAAADEAPALIILPTTPTEH